MAGMFVRKRRGKLALNQLVTVDSTLNDNFVENEASCSTRHCENIPGSSISPRCVMRRELLGNLARPGPLCNNFQRDVIEKRVKSLRISWRHRILLATLDRPGYVLGVSSMALDPVDQRFLLCGSNSGSMSVVDLEMPLATHSTASVEHKVMILPSERSHHGLVNYCQWYPRDTSIFATSGVDYTLKLWDANKAEVVEEFAFDRRPHQNHWCEAHCCTPAIVVTNLTQYIVLIDPRTGSAMQHLRWKEDVVTSIRWFPNSEYLLASGGASGKIAIWDSRCARAQLSSLKYHDTVGGGVPRRMCVNGIRFSKDGLYLVASSTDDRNRFGLWNAHSLKPLRKVHFSTERFLKVDPSPQFEVFSDGRVLRACVPDGDEIGIVTIEETKKKDDFQVRLNGHIRRVNACVYREKYHQVISSANDQMILIWSPDMDEQVPDEKWGETTKLHEDNWSDED